MRGPVAAINRYVYYLDTVIAPRGHRKNVFSIFLYDKL